MLEGKSALLLDMNSTFMFGEDRFDDGQDFSIRYHELGGHLADREINNRIRELYRFLSELYPDQEHRYKYPSIADALVHLYGNTISPSEIEITIKTFAFHELGHIPEEYSIALHELSKHFVLGVVIDIWAPKNFWLDEFERAGVRGLFAASSFSSDHGIVKPAPEPFENVARDLGIEKSAALVIGDSVRRDLGGARAAGIDCVLVGGATHSDAVACFPDLLAFNESCRQQLKSLCGQTE